MDTRNLHLSYSLVLFFCTSLCFSEEFHSVKVGKWCTTSSDCGSDLLFCSENGVCLCNEKKANYVVELSQRNPPTYTEGYFCEVRECLIGKGENLRENGCTLGYAKCIERPAEDNYTNPEYGYCKCPLDRIGWRSGRDSDGYCQSMKPSSVGKECMSSKNMCDVSKGLKCNVWKCECHYSSVFDFDKDTCVGILAFQKMYGKSKLGQYKQYCQKWSDCNGDLSCKNNRCDCPENCDGEIIQTEETCYCYWHYNSLMIILIVIALSAITFFICVIIFCIRKKHMANLEQLRRRGNRNNISAPTSPSAALVSSPSPGYVQPSAPTIETAPREDDLPTYSEAMSKV